MTLRLPFIPLVLACAFLHGCNSPTSTASDAAPPAAPPPQKFGDATPLEWSVRMAKSEMGRVGEKQFYDVNPQAKWSYTVPLVGLSLQGDDAPRQPGRKGTGETLARRPRAHRGGGSGGDAAPGHRVAA